MPLAVCLALGVAQPDSARFTVTLRLGDATIGPLDVTDAVVPGERRAGPSAASWFARLRGASAATATGELLVTLPSSPVVARLGRLAAVPGSRAPVGTCELVAVGAAGAPLRTLVARGCAVARVEPLPAARGAPSAVQVHLSFDRLASR